MTMVCGLLIIVSLFSSVSYIVCVSKMQCSINNTETPYRSLNAKSMHRSDSVPWQVYIAYQVYDSNNVTVHNISMIYY